MTKILFDASKKNLVDSSIEETLRKLNSANSFGTNISVPSGFRRAGDIANCCAKINSASQLLKSTQTWATQNTAAFQNKTIEAKVRIKKIETITIKRKELLIK